MGRVIPYAEVVRLRRRREGQRRHACSLTILSASVVAARDAARVAAPAERPVWSARLRKLEELLVYAVEVAEPTP